VLRLYALVLPVLAAVVAWRSSVRASGTAAELAAALPLLGAAAYAHLVTQPFWVNGFGWERGGARLYFVAPVELTAVLRAKNGATALAALGLFAAAAISALTAGAAPPAWAVVGAIALHLGLAPALHGAGNLVSAWNPRAAAFGAQRGGHVAPASALAGIAIVSTASGIFSLPVLAAVHAEEPWLMPAGWALLGVAALVAYRLTLPRVAALVGARREALLAAVCDEEA
jgi:ABC-2 type transport system permease protein